MNKDSLREYIFAAQRGDRKALVELLTYSWGIVHYQCGKLLPSRQSAEKMTTVVLKTVAEKLDSLQEPERFYNWMGHLTAMRCMQGPGHPAGKRPGRRVGGQEELFLPRHGPEQGGNRPGGRHAGGYAGGPAAPEPLSL